MTSLNQPSQPLINESRQLFKVTLTRDLFFVEKKHLKRGLTPSIISLSNYYLFKANIQPYAI